MLTGLLQDLLDLALPSACAGCAAPGVRVLCAPCTDELVTEPGVRELEGLRVGLAGPYRDPARGALVGHKEHGRLALARPLGGALAAAVLALEPPDAGLPLVLVPAPSAPRAVRARGFDHARRLAAAAAASLRAVGVPATSAPVLRQARRVHDQAGLSLAARADNLAGALAVRGSAPRGPVVVVDDVVTTGATVREAARALRAAGAQVLGAAGVAGA